jgi:hypothetical protein
LGLRRVVLLCVASCSFVVLVSAGFAAGTDRSSTLPAITAAQADCSKATALELATRFHLAALDAGDSVAQWFCGAFVGPGSQAMVIATTPGTCGVNGWAVLSFAGGDWQLVGSPHSGWTFAVAAIGSDIRETTPVPTGKFQCPLTNGKPRSRIWHWDGTRLVAGPWKQETKGEPEPRGFYSPSHRIACGMYDDSSFSSVDCQSFAPRLSQKVKMNRSGRLTICQDRGTRNRCNIGNPGEGTPTLGYGKQITVGRFRCLSLRSGMRCTVIQSGKGFLINSAGVRRVGS